jgi:hypothetical protein
LPLDATRGSTTSSRLVSCPLNNYLRACLNIV